jgi:hypothetical protein
MERATGSAPRTGRVLLVTVVAVALLGACGEAGSPSALVSAATVKASPAALGAPLSRVPFPEPSPSAIPAVLPSPSIADWVLHERRPAGFSLLLPPAWRPLGVNPATLTELLAAYGGNAPEMAALLEGLGEDIGDFDVELWAFDLVPTSTMGVFVANVAVLRQPLPSNIALEEFVGAFVARLERTPTVERPVARRQVDLVAGVGEELRYRLDLRRPMGATLALARVQYLVAHGSDVFVVTLTSATDEAQRYAPVFERIGRSFRGGAVSSGTPPSANSGE